MIPVVQAKYWLPADLARRVRIAAVARGRSYSCLASQILAEGLDRLESGETEASASPARPLRRRIVAATSTR